MAKNIKAKIKEEAEEAKDAVIHVKEEVHEHVEHAKEEVKSLKLAAIEAMEKELELLKPGHREIDLAVEEARAALEKLKSLVAFIEKALNPKKK